MTTYQITNHASGQDLGNYDGATPEEAIAAMLADAGEPGAEPDPALVARPVTVGRPCSLFSLTVRETRDGRALVSDSDGPALYWVPEAALDEEIAIPVEEDDDVGEPRLARAYERWCGQWGAEPEATPAPEEQA